MDCSPPDSSVHGIFQERALEQVAIFFSRGSSRARDQTRVSCVSRIGRQIFMAVPPGKKVPYVDLHSGPLNWWPVRYHLAQHDSSCNWAQTCLGHTHSIFHRASPCLQCVLGASTAMSTLSIKGRCQLCLTEMSHLRKFPKFERTTGEERRTKNFLSHSDTLMSFNFTFK